MREVGELSLACPLKGDVPIHRETLSLPDGLETPVLRHVPPAVGGPPVLYLHGIQSHPGWFVGSAQALARAGHEVFQVTRRGSGTAADRGDAKSARQLLDDVDAAVTYVLRQAGARGPKRDASGLETSGAVSLLAVSWGGKLAVAWALARPSTASHVASLTLVCPGIVSLVDVSTATKLAIALARCFRPRKYFDLPLNEVSLFTDNPDMRRYLKKDRHRLLQATARFLVASAALDRIIARAPDGSLKPATTLLLARRDRIIDNAGTEAVIDRLTGGRARVVELDAAHTIEFEPDPSEFYDVLCRAAASQR